jgi:hypothetical protein
MVKYTSCSVTSGMTAASIFGGTDNYSIYGSKTDLQIRSLISVVKHSHEFHIT